jgi:hypothetical protein
MANEPPVGSLGRTLAKLDPCGPVEIQGTVHTARTTGKAIKAKRNILVTGFDSSGLIVVREPAPAEMTKTMPSVSPPNEIPSPSVGGLAIHPDWKSKLAVLGYSALGIVVLRVVNMFYSAFVSPIEEDRKCFRWDEREHGFKYQDANTLFDVEITVSGISLHDIVVGSSGFKRDWHRTFKCPVLKPGSLILDDIPRKNVLCVKGSGRAKLSWRKRVRFDLDRPNSLEENQELEKLRPKLEEAMGVISFREENLDRKAIKRRFDEEERLPWEKQPDNSLPEMSDMQKAIERMNQRREADKGNLHAQP